LEKDNPSDPNGLTVKFKKYEYYTTSSCISTSDPKHKRRSCTLQKHEGKKPTTEHAQDNENQNTTRPDPKPDLQATEHWESTTKAAPQGKGRQYARQQQRNRMKRRLRKRRNRAHQHNLTNNDAKPGSKEIQIGLAKGVLRGIYGKISNKEGNIRLKIAPKINNEAKPGSKDMQISLTKWVLRRIYAEISNKEIQVATEVHRTQLLIKTRELISSQAMERKKAKIRRCDALQRILYTTQNNSNPRLSQGKAEKGSSKGKGTGTNVEHSTQHAEDAHTPQQKHGKRNPQEGNGGLGTEIDEIGVVIARLRNTTSRSLGAKPWNGC